MKRRSLWGWIWRAVLWAPVLGAAAALCWGLFLGGMGVVNGLYMALVGAAAP